MSQFFKERFIGRDNQDVYASEYERIFGKKDGGKVAEIEKETINQCGCGDIAGQCGCIFREVEGLEFRIEQLETQLKDANETIAFLYNHTDGMNNETAKMYLRKYVFNAT